jgi:hypothetical protein
MDTETRAWLQERIDGRLAVAVALAWLVLLNVAMALEPATNQPEPWFGVLIQLMGTALIATMIVGLVMQRRFGLVASVGAALFGTALSIACPLSGHHPFGAWWFGQMACVLALVGVSVAALRWSSAGLPHRLTSGDAASRGSSARTGDAPDRQV